MASETYWVLRWRSDGAYRRRNWWEGKRSKADRFDSLDDAREERRKFGKSAKGLIAIARVTRRQKARRPKPDRLILTGEAARLVREWREESANYQANTIDELHSRGFSCTPRLLAALASEEVCDG